MMEFVNGKDDNPYIMENNKCLKPPTRKTRDHFQPWKFSVDQFDFELILFGKQFQHQVPIWRLHPLDNN